MKNMPTQTDLFNESFPAMAAGISDHIWTIKEIGTLIYEWRLCFI
jgi:hypothetical protein